MAISIDVRGIPGVRKFLNSKNALTIQKVAQAITKSAIYVQGEVKFSIAGQRPETRSVDTGRFLNSVSVKSSKDNAQIFSALPYADFLEFGTSKFTGRRHFSNTADRSKGKVTQIFSSEIAKI